MFRKKTGIQRQNGRHVLFLWRWHRMVRFSPSAFFLIFLQFFQPNLARTQVNSITGLRDNCYKVLPHRWHVNQLACSLLCGELENEGHWHFVLACAACHWGITDVFIVGSVSKFAFENKLIWKTNFAQDGQDNITPRGLPPRIFDKGKPIQNSWSRPIKGPSALSPLKKLM